MPNTMVIIYKKKFQMKNMCPEQKELEQRNLFFTHIFECLCGFFDSKKHKPSSRNSDN